MPAIHFRQNVDAPPEDVYAALATQDGLAGNWTDQLEVPEQTGGVARFGFGPDWAKTLELRIDALDPGRRVEWTPGGTVVHFTHRGWPDQAAEGEMAMCGYTWAMIIDRLARQVAGGARALLPGGRAAARVAQAGTSRLGGRALAQPDSGMQAGRRTRRPPVAVAEQLHQ